MQNTDNTNNTRNSFSTNTNNAIDAAQRESIVKAIESDRAEGQTPEQIADEHGISVDAVTAYFTAADALAIAVLLSGKKQFDEAHHQRS